jgi:hypothetical protein
LSISNRSAPETGAKVEKIKMPEKLTSHVDNLIEAVKSGLSLKADEAVAETLDRLESQVLSVQTFSPSQPLIQPVCAYFPKAIAAAAIHEPEIATHLAAIAPNLRWLQSASYSDEFLSGGFSNNYAWCEIIGPKGFYKGSDFLLGFLLLGPNIHYKDHYHPAPELYWPLTAPSDWKKGDGTFVARQAGEIIWHPSMVIHATITHDQPLLALYAWTEKTETSAKLV